MLLFLLAACTAPDGIALDDTAAEDTGAPDDTGADTDTDTGPDDTNTAPVDRDADGSPADEDCDDLDGAVFPGAEEVWNGVDDDCDAVVDGDGDWTGEVRLNASAVYEGRRYDFTLDCPFDGTRAAGAFDWAITCTPDAEDVNAQRLLGATLVVTPKDTDAPDARWAGAVEFTSGNGWDSDGEGVIDVDGFDDADVDVEMAGVSLAASGSGEIARV